MSGDRSGFMFEPLKSVPLNQEINEQKNVPKLQENCVPGMDSKEAGYWCKCMNCQTMPTYRENVCCRSVQALKEKLKDESCISKTASFEKMCLDVEVLEMLLSAINDLAAEELPRQLRNR